MTRSRNPEKTRQKIIAATHKVLRDGGYFTRFSLDTIAEEAGVSKGGLLHHFGTKEELLHATAQDSITRFEARLTEELYQQEENAPGRFTRAYIEAVLGTEHGRLDKTSPVLLNFLRSIEGETRFNYWQPHTEQDSLPIPLATIIRLALDGLIYTEMIDNQPIDEALRQQIRQHLLHLIDNPN